MGGGKNRGNKHGELSWKVGTYSALVVLQRLEVGVSYGIQNNEDMRIMFLFDGTLLSQKKSELFGVPGFYVAVT